MKRLSLFRVFTLLALELMGALIAGGAVLGGLLAWRLSEGPLRMEALQPWLVSGLSQAASPYRVTVGSTALDWAGNRSALGVAAQDVRLYSPEGRLVAALPSIEIGFSLPALLIGRVSPDVIRLVGPQLRALRTMDGAIELSLAGTTTPSEPSAPDSATAAPTDVLDSWLGAIIQPPSATSPLGALSRIEITAARVDVTDYQFGVQWRAPQADFLLQRDLNGVRGHVNLEMAVGTKNPRLSGDFLFDPTRADLRMSVRLERFNPAELASWTPAFSSLSRLNVPFSGTVRARWTRPSGFTDVAFDLSAGQGTLGAQADNEPLNLSYAQLVGTINRLQHRVEISNLHADFNGIVLEASANATRSGNQILVDASATINNMPAAELSRYWLPGWAHNARDWVTGNIVSGQVPQATATVQLAVPLDNPAAVTPVSLNGHMDLKNLTVHYFRPLPPATSADGSADYDLSGFRVHVDRAMVEGNTVSSAQINLLGLTDDSDRAEIEVAVDSSVLNQLKLIDHDPLRYARRLGLDASQAEGRAVTRARFEFPLFHDLPIEAVAISVTSQMSDVKLPDVVADQDLTNGQLQLMLDGGGMKITGTGNIGPAPAEFTWQESFVSDVSPSSEITFKGAMDEAARQAFRISWPEVIGATIGVEGTYQKERGQPARVDAKLDLTRAEVALPWFGWQKPAGRAANGQVSLLVDQNGVQKVSSFRATGSGLTLRGAVDFAAHSQWQKVTLSQISVPGTRLTGSVMRLPESGYALDFAGPEADIQALFDKPADEAASVAPAVVPANTEPEARVPLDIRFAIDEVTTAPDRSLHGAKGRLVRNTKGWSLLDIAGTVGSGVPIVVQLLPEGAGRRLDMRSDDAGAMLSTLRLMENIRGGTLTVSGRSDGPGPVPAQAELRNFTYLEAKTLRRLAQQAQPEGAEALAKDEGLKFGRLRADIRYSEEALEVKNARMAGDLMGLTLGGQVNLLRGQIDLSGTLVPLYGINSLVSGIPVLGWLLTGGEGGGIFAATYTVKGPLANPQTSVNPLAMLAPGFLRELFFVDNR